VLKNLTVSVLGCILLSSCASNPVYRPIEVSAKPVEKPKLTLPQADEVNMKPIVWMLVTPDTAEEAFQSLEGRPKVLFSLTDEGYSNLGVNISAIRALVQQQEAIIRAYKNYYEAADKALEEANAEIQETASEAAEGQIVETSDKKWWQR
jgi:hypothetical protein